MQEATGTPPGGRDPGSTIWGLSLHHNNTSAAKGHFGILPLAYQLQGLSPSHHKPALPEPPRAAQRATWEVFLTLHWRHSLPANRARGQTHLPAHPQQRALPQQKGICNPFRAPPTRGYASGEQRGVYCWIPYYMSS